MPLFYQQYINEHTRLGVWRITEDEPFFLERVPLHRDITHPAKRLQHLAGRYLLQYLFPEFPYGMIRIADTFRPYLEDEAFHFSISHCGDMAAAIVSRYDRVGVDAEISTPRVLRILNKFLHPEELHWYHAYPKDPDPGIYPDESFREHLLPTLLWSVKEAVFKWHGAGQVDFSEHIRIQPFVLHQTGRIKVIFRRSTPVGLDLNYRIFRGLCVCWVNGEPEAP